MGIRPEIADMKGWIVVDLTEEKLATLLAASDQYAKAKVDDPGYYGVEEFEGDPKLVRADLLTLPGYKHLRVVEEDDNFREYCGIGWDNFKSKSAYNPKKKDLSALKTILEKWGFVVDERIEGDRFLYMG